MKKIASIALLGMALSFSAVASVQPSVQAVGTCVGFQVTPENHVSKIFLKNYTYDQCQAQKPNFTEVKWAVGANNMSDVIIDSAACEVYSCSYPCIDHTSCTCATGSCY